MSRRALYIQFNNPAGLPPLEHSAQILAERGWEVLVLGARQQSDDRLCFAPHSGIEVRLLTHCPPGWQQKLHYVRFLVWTWLTALFWRPKWIYASDMFSCPAALILSFWPGWRVAYHEHDSPGGGSQKSSFIRLVLWCRKRLARRADFCVLPNEKRLEYFKEQTGTTQPVLCVWNCPRNEEASVNIESRKRKAENGKFVIFYHGSIVPARLPLTVIQALAQLPENVILQFAGYKTIGHPDYVEKIFEEARKRGLAGRAEYLGTIAQRSDLLAQCRKADIGLAFMPISSTDINEQTMAGASNKPFDYLACGLALLVSDLPSWNRLFVNAGLAHNCDPGNASSIADAVRWFLEHPNETLQMGERGRQRISNEWNYETQFEPVLHCMTRA